MRERPIIFSGPMVRALLEGRKTQTRRVMKLQYFELDGGGHPFTQLWDEEHAWRQDVLCPYGRPGDRLWVKETFAPDYFTSEPWCSAEERHGYRADWTKRAAETVPEPKWKPSIFMPRSACRLVLEITEVRVQRLQDISEEDAKAEGVGPAPFCKSGRPGGMEHVESFEGLWDSINGKRGYGWSSNPWVWAITVRRLP